MRCGDASIEKTDHTEKDIEEYQDYCLKDDCWAGVRLFKAMRPHIDFLRAPIRGAFMMEIERMRWHGIPIDTSTYYRTEQCAGKIASAMREELNRKLRAEAWKIYKRMPKGKTETRSSARYCRCARTSRGLLPGRVQAQDHARTDARMRDSASGRSEDRQVQLRHQVAQEHDRDLSAAEGVLRRQAND